ncbi:type III PLP-dependent enzyme [Plantactinospora sp. S1510]|uniref:Type III PLP-dependent enzyme n=1 Tax=Plantactinospora alkalitolerans TaxID=2789879 RepID=A0ABS0GT35_9ACTN|nr:type III PLP-dependent enzyme [Plantactinospora alkalitolerans]MBF9129256.1 type III PLP-dependent enzyme [Plantactinospora alkalitolerans]
MTERYAEVADRFGTPVYVYDGDLLRQRYESLRSRLHPDVDVFYSVKANPNISICGLFGALGAGIEVSSMAELVTAERAGVDPADVIFLGPGKSAAELRACCERGIHAVVCESLDEVLALDAMEIADGMRVVLRINPDFDTHGSRLSMGGKPRQFGIDEEILRDRPAALTGLRRVRVVGIHAYLGTRILDASTVLHNTRGILGTAEAIAGILDIPLEVVDIGGGWGVPYFDNETDLDGDEAVDGVNQAVSAFLERHPGTRIITELGRYLVGWCGTYVVRARYVKRSKGEWFVVADGGTNHHMAAVGIGSFVKRNFPIRSLSRPDEPAEETYTVTGPLCTPNDVVGKRVRLPEVRPGDLLGVARSGAYGPSASPVLFLSHGHPAEVLLLDGEAHLIRHRDTVDDLLRSQRLIPLPVPATSAAPGRTSHGSR